MSVLQNSGTLRVDNFAGGAASVNNTTAVGSNFTAGNGAIVAISHYGNNSARQVTAVSVGGTAGTLAVRRDNGQVAAEIWVVENMTGGNRTVTMDVDAGSGQYITYSVIEVDNLASTPTDQTGTGGPTNSTAPSATTAAAGAQADEIFVAVYYDGTGVVQSSITPPSGYTAMHAELDGVSFVGGGAAYKISSSANGAAETATFGLTGAVTWDTAIAGFKLSASASSEQEGFRFRNDDGSETAATWAASQDADKTAPLSTNLRLRCLVNGTGDLASAAFTLRFQKNGSGGYVAVPVGATVPEAYGTVTFGAIGTGANGSTTVAPSYPAGITAGQYLVCVVTSGATNSETPTTPSGWTLLATGASTDGTYGVDTGPRRVTAFGKIAAGTESGTLTVSITNGGTCRGTISRFTKAGSGSWDVEAQGGNDSTSGTGVSITFASMNWNTGDAVLVATGQRVDGATQSSQSLTASGVTFGTRTNRAATAVTTGNDHRHSVDTFAAISSTSDVDAAPTWAYTASAAASAGGVIVRLREYTAPVTNEVYIATSANITAGGEATTAQLTAPSGKSTSDFVTGRMWDNENGTDSIDITTDDYTELEWCLQAQSPATNGDYFDFRVYAGGSALNTYTVTPRWTLGTGGAYSLTMGQGTYSQTGQAVALRAGRNMAPVQGSYSLTGQAVTLKPARKLAAAQGSYSLSGQSVTLTYDAAAATIQIEQGTYSLTGQALGLKVARTLALAQGSYALTGQAVTLRAARKMAAAQGSYSLTGQAAGLKAGRKLAAAQGTYAVTGATVLADFAITISSGTYTLTGQAVTLTYGSAAKVIAIGQGTYSVTGQAVALRAARKLALAQGTYSLTGQAAGLKRGLKVAIGQGSYSLTGTAVGLKPGRRLVLAQGTYAITGQTLNLKAGHVLPAGQGTYSLSGTAVALTYSGEGDKTIAIGQGSYTLAGQAVALRVARKVAAAFGTYAITGQAAGVRGGRRLALAQGSYSLTGQTLALARTRVFVAAQGLYSITGQPVGVRSARRVTISAGGYTLTGQAVGIYPSRRIAAVQGAYALTGRAVTLKPARRVAIAAGAYALAGQAIAMNYSGALTPISDARTYVVRGENRVYLVPGENRTYPIRAENRTWRIT